MMANPSYPAAGSRYVYDLYYEKEAISKSLYDYLIKNSYADANLIAKWKKQGYEKVRHLSPSQTAHRADHGALPCSFAVYGVFRPRRRTSTRPVYVESPKRS